MLVDTHCHLNHEQFNDDLTDVIARAEAADIRRMIVIGFDLTSSQRAVELAEQFDSVYAAVAVHPHDAQSYDADTETVLRQLAIRPNVVAIGEIGLDYHYDHSPRAEQHSAFRAQLAMAKELRLPVIIHCREAYEDTLDVLESEMDGEFSGVMHCWGGTMEEAQRSLDLGMFLGFGGVITFKNADEVREVARQAPSNRILIETDAPYLAPVPHRGKRNEPSYTQLVCEKLAELRQIPLDMLAAQTTANASVLFGGLIS